MNKPCLVAIALSVVAAACGGSHGPGGKGSGGSVSSGGTAGNGGTTDTGNGGLAGSASDASIAGAADAALGPDPLRTHLEQACSTRPPVVAGPRGLLAPASGVLHCAGQSSSDFADYWNAMPAGQKPAVYMAYWGLKDWWSTDAQGFAASIASDLAQHPELLSVQLGLSMTSEASLHYEADVAAGDLDPQLNALLDALESVGRPIYLRIGYEFNGLSWNGYLPETYRRAFVHVAQLVRARRLEIATVWDAAASGVNNVMDYYPGDDVVDWWGINIFEPDQIGNALTTTFLANAVSHGKPVMIGESSAATVGTAGGQSSWDGWFAPYFSLIAEHPEIMMFCYINTDWTAYPDFPQWAPWGDCRIQQSAMLVGLYGSRLGDPRFLHATDEITFRSRFGLADTQPPGTVGGLRAGNDYAAQILWSCSPETDGVAAYLIERDGVQVGRAVNGSYVDNSLRAGQRATYQVTAMDFAGNSSLPSVPLALAMPNPFQRVLNADFENGLANWGLFVQSGAAAKLDPIHDPAGGGAARVTVSVSTGTNWHIQLMQSLTLHAGMGYRIHFTARADAATAADITLQQIASPYAVYFSKSVDLTTTWQEFTLDAANNAAEEPSHLAIMLGAAVAHVVDVDDFTLQEIAP